MLLHQAGKKIVRAGVAELVGGFQVLAQAANDDLVIGEQRGEHSAGIRIFAGLFLEARQLQKLLQRPGRDGVERASSLRDFVDDFVERLVLALEKLVQLAKVGTYDVPVKAPRLDVEHELVREQRVEDRAQAVALLLADADIRFHAPILMIDRKAGREPGPHEPMQRLYGAVHHKSN